MRFVILVIAAAGTGALSAGAIQTMFPQTAHTFDAVWAPGSGSSRVQFQLSDLNPVKAWEDFKRKLTSGDYGAPINLGSSSPKFPSVSLGQLMPKTYDMQFGKDAFARSINSQMNQNYRRMQDLNAYARNPMGWHGAPPH
jgi:hypothetical protein